MRELAKKLLESFNLHQDKIAIVDSESEITYLELKNRIYNLERYIKSICSCKKYKDREVVCGILVKKNINGIVAVLSCLFSEITFVPIDDYQPDVIIDYMIINSRINLLLTDAYHVEVSERILNAHDSIKCINIDDIENLTILEDLTILENTTILEYTSTVNSSNTIMYHLYTSGSTDRPKAVLQRDEAVVYFAESYIKEINLTSSDCMTLFSSFGHDAAIIDIFSCFLVGATLFPKDLRDVREILKLPKWIIDHKITVWHSVPSVYRTIYKNKPFKSKDHALRIIVLGGERVREDDYYLFESILNHENMDFYNLYGQTESSFSGGLYIKNPSQCEIFGGPLENTTFLIKQLDNTILRIDRGGLVKNYKEVDEILDKIDYEEIVIMSDYISLGYLNLEKNRSFLTLGSGKRIYKTGDYVKYLRGESFKMIGRKDSQCKINGHRVELGVIENTILKIPEVTECIVGTKEQNGQIKLYAAINTNCGKTLIEINRFLINYLPQYMMLHAVSYYDVFPTTISGKVNRKIVVDNF